MLTITAVATMASVMHKTVIPIGMIRSPIGIAPAEGVICRKNSVPVIAYGCKGSQT